jgi:23S rRNA (adenine2503-C2)-methyltransferase
VTSESPSGHLLAVYRPDISEALDLAGAEPYRRSQVLEHLFRRPSQPFTEATALPATLRVLLDGLQVSSLALADARTADDGTVKLLLQTRDEALVETVMMPYRRRVTACISSQVGCPVGCGFCATGARGFQRNLSIAEIVDQVRAVSVFALPEGRRVSNLVYMGMGEPLLNLGAVLGSIRVLAEPRGGGLSRRSISVSSVGIPTGILRLGKAEPQVNLALSLHAADDDTRARLIPPRYLHPLDRILSAAWQHFSLTHRKLLVEYVLLRGINDSIDDARRLAALLSGHVVTVNLLAWNHSVDPLPQPSHPVDSLVDSPDRSRDRSRDCGQDRKLKSFRGLDANGREDRRDSLVFSPSPSSAVAAFRDTLRKAHVETVIRRSKGAEIGAACGQLAGRASR